MLKRDFNGDEYTRRLESRISDVGYVSLGVPGGTTTLMAAMMTASSEVVSLLLSCGANIQCVDVMGNDAFMFASIFGRPKNLQCWLERVKDWDLNRQNTVIGGFALGVGVYMGANKLETVKVLLDAGASIDYRTFSGSTLLFNTIGNEDSDPNVVRLVLRKLYSVYQTGEFESVMNYRRIPQTMKWKCISPFAKLLYQTGMSKSSLLRHIAIEAGTSALNLAVARGDVEIVKILIEYGADPNVENDLGMNAFEMCDEAGPFPSVRKVLEEHGGRD